MTAEVSVTGTKTTNKKVAVLTFHQSQIVPKQDCPKITFLKKTYFAKHRCKMVFTVLYDCMSGNVRLTLCESRIFDGYFQTLFYLFRLNLQVTPLFSSFLCIPVNKTYITRVGSKRIDIYTPITKDASASYCIQYPTNIHNQAHVCLPLPTKSHVKKTRRSQQTIISIFLLPAHYYTV